MAAAVVADASVAAAWCFPDERTDFTDVVLDALTSGSREVLAPISGPMKSATAFLWVSGEAGSAWLMLKDSWIL